MYSLKTLCRGASNKYIKHMFRGEIKKINTFWLKKSSYYIAMLIIGYLCLVSKLIHKNLKCSRQLSISLPIIIMIIIILDLGFTALSRIFHLYRADRSSRVGENRRTQGKNHLTIRKQNLAFPHVARARLESQR